MLRPVRGERSASRLGPGSDPGAVVRVGLGVLRRAPPAPMARPLLQLADDNRVGFAVMALRTIGAARRVRVIAFEPARTAERAIAVRERPRDRLDRVFRVRFAMYLPRSMSHAKGS